MDERFDSLSITIASTDGRDLQRIGKIAGRIKALNPNILLFMFAVVVTLLSCIHYVVTLLEWTDIGFTLDDSWIHLQYARTLHEGRPWEYSPGVPSAGATSPLWAFILSSIFLFTQEGAGLVMGTYTISILFYVGSSFLVGQLTNRYTGGHIWGYPAIVGFVLVPRNTWLMLSGMELPVFMLTILLALTFLDMPGWRYDILLGIACGLAYLSRPEGFLVVALCFPLRVTKIWEDGELNRERVRSIVIMILASLFVVLPWVLHCMSTNGTPLPDTFFVKVHRPTQWDIEVWSFWWRVWLVDLPFIMGGLVGGAYLLMKRNLGCAVMWAFAAGLIGLYRLNMPMQALINNARYLVPVFTVLQILTVVGVGVLAEGLAVDVRKPEHKREIRVLGVILALLLIVPSTLGYIHQADLYGNSVKNINEQQVVIGKWLAEKTPENATIAMVDAGGIAFFSNRTTIDLVGLTTPDMVHLNMTPREKLIYIRDRNCSYLVTFNGWFWPWSNELQQGWQILFTVYLPDNVISGADTKSVYFIDWALTDLAA
ncbi:MAG: hypothetical protein ACXADS_09290 [Candidatus Thorarchaeota archaeon]|jgi:hypothetical protein